MLNVLIVDDEPHCRTILKKKIRLCDESMNIIGEKSNIEETIAFFEREKQAIDVLFLDIEMPNGTGFELLERLPRIDFEIIFTTSHHEFALDAFRYNVLDYLIKPIKKEELDRAINKIKERHKQEKKGLSSQKKVAALLAERKQNQQFDRIGLATTTGIEFVPIKEILYCKADGAYTSVYLNHKKKPVVISKNLGKLEEVLPENLFFRISRFYLINLKRIQRYERAGYIIMEDGTEIIVPKRKRDDFLRLMGNLL